MTARSAVPAVNEYGFRPEQLEQPEQAPLFFLSFFFKYLKEIEIEKRGPGGFGGILVPVVVPGHNGTPEQTQIVAQLVAQF